MVHLYTSQAVVCVFSKSVCMLVHTFKHEHLGDQLADRNQILSEASLGLGKGCIRFWARSDWNSGFHGNLWENLVNTLPPSFLIEISSYLQVTRTSKTSGGVLNSAKLEQGLRSYLPFSVWKNPSRLIMGKMLQPL